jgi:glutamine cyclotransferase
MNRKAALTVSFIIVIIVAVAAIVLLLGNQGQESSTPTQYTYKVINTYPHDTTAFTEGLVYDNGSLCESTGMMGASSLRRVDLQSGNIQQEHMLPSEYFGEGLTAVNGTLVQLTWQSHIGFIYEEQSFRLQGNFSYPTEGWGLTCDGSRLIMSCGNATLHFLDPNSYAVIGQVTVKDGATEVTNINELEYVNGDVYANIWQTTKIAIINPTSGQVKGWVDLSGLHQQQGTDDVLNGIAYDKQNGRLFVTGKDWPNLYQIELTPKT